MQFDVVTIGTALLDIYLKSNSFGRTPSKDFGNGEALCVEFGGKTEVQEVEVTTGGGATNNAVSYARKGFQTGIVAELGRDLIAAAVVADLKREKVGCDWLVQEPHEETGLASIMVAQDGGRSVAVYRGAAAMLEKRDIPWSELYPSWIHLSSLGAPMEVYEGIIGHAVNHGVKIAVNPGKHEIEGAKDWGGLALFNNVDVLLVNREEAQLLSGINFEDEEVWSSDHCLVGPKMSVITDGKNGGKVCVDGSCIFYEAEEVETVEETGAGDAFGSGLVAALMKGHEIETAIAWGKKQAANVVQYMGAKKGLLDLESINGRL
jgi:ribokinase